MSYASDALIDALERDVDRLERENGQLKYENAKLKELAKLMHRTISALQDTFDASLVYNGVELSAEYFETELNKLGIEVGE